MLKIDIAKEAQDPAVTGIDFSPLGPGDLLNMILQRSEVLYDVPEGQGVIKAWSAGDAGPIERVVAEKGLEIARRTAGVVHAEFRSLAPALKRLKPKRIADIGCGYALFDLFAAKVFGTRTLLIDIETNEVRNFGYTKEAAAYTSMDTARRLMAANGIDAATVETVNPTRSDPLSHGAVDLCVSFKSCGFHYPAETYAGYFRDGVAAGGAVILDLRSASAERQLAELAGLGQVEDLPAPERKARRVLIRKAGG